MKTKQALFAIMLGVVFSTVACKRCQTCVDQQSGYEVEVCRSAYSVPGLYDAQIKDYEDAGYDCN